MLIAFMHARRLEFFVLQTREHSVSTLHEVNQDSTSPCLMTLPLPLRNDNLPTLNTCPISPPTRPVSPPLLEYHGSNSSFLPVTLYSALLHLLCSLPSPHPFSTLSSVPSPPLFLFFLYFRFVRFLSRVDIHVFNISIN